MGNNTRMSPTVSVDLGSLVELYDQSDQTRESVSHNVGLLKCIRGGLWMAERHRLTFDPRGEYLAAPRAPIRRRVPC